MTSALFPDLSHKTRVLVVDDDHNSSFLINELLQLYGYEVFRVGSSMQWLQTLAELSPDIILLNLKLKKDDGYHLLKQQQQHPQFKEIPTIIISSYTEIHRKQALDMGAFCYIEKPFLCEHLIYHIKRGVASKQMSYS